ncbi:hypothetical protein [Mesorhizobium sp. SP-1A]|uniref:hypothetical protein n=1 Tax=Mesorhizobium sp. SP-1A TaxID=3077840 RepID=UPI0028F6C7D2|nr:hypothetical protein [Mesorhizobium sp. SP-1A]
MPMLTRKLLGIISAVTLMVGINNANAQDRSNPFVAPPTEAEEQARQDERMRNIVWELQPELKSLIMQDVSAAQASLEIKMRRRIDAAIKEVSADVAKQVPAPSAGGENGGSENSPVASNIPENSKFISCVNGKALYRDSNNTLFQVAESGDGIKHCSN